MDNNDIKKINSKKANKIIFKGNQKKPIKKSDIISRAKNIPINLRNIIRIKHIQLYNKKSNLKAVDNKKSFLESRNSNNLNKISLYTDKIKQNGRKIYFESFLENYSNPLNRYINNKPKNILNKRGNYQINNFSKSFIDMINIKKNSTIFITHDKYETINSYNNTIKNSFLLKKKTINKKYDISGLFEKKLKKSKNIQKKNNINNKKFALTQVNDKNDDINSIFDIESEHKKPIILKNIGLYNVNKPYEYNMKFSTIKDFENDENENLNNQNMEKIIIGNIEGYKDIIESDKNNKKNEIKNSNKNKFEKNLLLSTNKKMKKFKEIKNNKEIKCFEKSNIWDDNSSDIYDLNFENNYCLINENFMSIENEYDFEDLPTNGNESKINKILTLEKNLKLF